MNINAKNVNNRVNNCISWFYHRVWLFTAHVLLRFCHLINSLFACQAKAGRHLIWYIYWTSNNKTIIVRPATSEMGHYGWPQTLCRKRRQKKVTTVNRFVLQSYTYNVVLLHFLKQIFKFSFVMVTYDFHFIWNHILFQKSYPIYAKFLYKLTMNELYLPV